MAGRKIKLPLRVNGWVNNYGKPQYRLRLPGKSSVALPGLPWSPEFMAAYEAAIAGAPPPPRPPIGADRTKPGTLNDAIVRFYQHPNFLNIGHAHRTRHRQKLEKFRQEGKTPRGELPLRSLNHETLAAIISQIDKPSPQRHLLGALRPLFTFCKAAGLIDANPCDGLKGMKRGNTGGYKTGSVDDIEKYQAHFPLGTMPRLALEIMLGTGVRRSDAYLFGRQHVSSDGQITIKTKKTGATVTMPMDADLRAAIDAMPPPPKGDTTPLAFVLNENGRPYKTAEAMGKWFGRCCKAAGVEFRAHGLRKACAVRLANLGLGASDIAAVLGHSDLREVQIYVAAYDRAQATARAMAALAKDKKRKAAR